MTTKKKLIYLISNKIEYLSKEDIGCAVDVVIEYFKEQLTEQNRIEIRNFGSFSIKKRKKTSSESISYNTVYYRMAKGVAEKINND